MCRETPIFITWAPIIENPRRASITSFSCVPGNGFQVRMFEVNRRVQGQDVVGVHIVGALGERPKTQFRAVEDGIFRLHEGGVYAGNRMPSSSSSLL